MVAPVKGAKRKDVSPLLASGDDKRRRRKPWRRPANTDRDSGSESKSDVEPIVLDEPISKPKEDRATRVARREEKNKAIEQKERESEENRLPSPELRELDSGVLRNLGVDWLEKIDAARLRSGNLKEDLSGQIKRFVDKTKGLVETLVSKLEDRGDPTYLRVQVTELTAQLRMLKSAEEGRIREIETLRREVEILRNSMRPGGSGLGTPGTSEPEVQTGKKRHPRRRV